MRKPTKVVWPYLKAFPCFASESISKTCLHAAMLVANGIRISITHVHILVHMHVHIHVHAHPHTCLYTGILISDGGVSVEQGASAQGIAPIKEAETTQVLVRYSRPLCVYSYGLYSYGPRCFAAGIPRPTRHRRKGPRHTRRTH